MIDIKNPKEFWKKVLAEVQLEVTPMVYGTIISRTAVENVGDKEITVVCEDEFIKKNIEKKYFEIVREAVNKVAREQVPLQFVTRKAGVTQAKTSQELGPLFSQEKDPETLLQEKISKSGLSPKFTFDNYIMGKSNQLAFAIATAVAEKPGETYNPVFIYSGVGLGKTHLLQAIGNKILKTKPGTKVVYTTGESFTNELIDAIQSGRGKGKYTSNDFRNKFRKADVFLIDDVQFIAGKEATQEEFFHTFNTLYLAQKQIVITSDRPPKDFTNIEERITSRFNSGIITDIQPPDLEMRMAILRTRRDAMNDPISNAVIDVIAEMVTTNTRELEGAYLQVLTYTKAAGGEITPEMAANALGKTLKEKEASKPVNMNQILNAVCNYYSIKSIDIKGKRRTKELVLPRQVAMFLIKELTDTPFMTIGDFLGGRDHTTIMHGVGKISSEQQQRLKLKQDIQNVKMLIYGE
ncbi:chromosomal replication initiator protein DnaA [candidate division WWE3 bacterium]|uniref:Chromosomal replication initiator protein DnaA n=1 Tax=candidate division WWE3 bacterium TaxID=2053526 RepID=A0A3A4ZCQ9_UNCKA|nr:MAG: chromosomal replication initiator protein DnaA [candidate division WWE3 bacterium]